MKFSLSQAAKEVGKSKPTISKAIKTGRLSAEKVGIGYQIDAAELFRVYPKPTESEPAKETPLSDTLVHEIDLLTLEAKMLREQVQRERQIVDDLSRRLDRADMLLEDHRPKPPEPAPARRKWFWQR